jgi:hypothetical protein
MLGFSAFHLAITESILGTQVQKVSSTFSFGLFAVWLLQALAASAPTSMTAAIFNNLERIVALQAVRDREMSVR